MSNEPKKHHYVPEYYQKNFLSDDGVLFAYKKTYGGIRSWKPSQLLYKENLHTLAFLGERTVMIEKFYSQIESEFSKYNALINGNLDDPGFISDLAQDEDFIRVTRVVIAFQFWRTPCKKKLAEQYSPRLLSLYDKASSVIKDTLGYDRKFIKFISKRGAKDDSIKVIQFLLLPLLTFNLLGGAERVRFLMAPESREFCSSDRPVLHEAVETLFSFRNFIFPFSKKLVLLGAEVSSEDLDVDGINNIIGAKAIELVISGSKTELEMLKKCESAEVSRLHRT